MTSLVAGFERHLERNLGKNLKHLVEIGTFVNFSTMDSKHTLWCLSVLKKFIPVMSHVCFSQLRTKVKTQVTRMALKHVCNINISLCSLLFERFLLEI